MPPPATNTLPSFISVAVAAYRNVAGADKDPVKTYVFATKPFAAPSGKTITSVRLPANTDLHVYTLAVN